MRIKFDGDPVPFLDRARETGNLSDLVLAEQALEHTVVSGADLIQVTAWRRLLEAAALEDPATRIIFSGAVMLDEVNPDFHSRGVIVEKPMEARPTGNIISLEVAMRDPLFKQTSGSEMVKRARYTAVGAIPALTDRNLVAGSAEYALREYRGRTVVSRQVPLFMEYADPVGIRHLHYNTRKSMAETARKVQLR